MLFVKHSCLTWHNSDRAMNVRKDRQTANLLKSYRTKPYKCSKCVSFWGTSYSRPPTDPYLTSPLLQKPGGATVYSTDTRNNTDELFWTSCLKYQTQLDPSNSFDTAATRHTQIHWWVIRPSTENCRKYGAEFNLKATTRVPGGSHATP